MSSETATPSTPAVTRHILIGITLVALALLFWKLADVFIIAFGGMVFATVLRVIAQPLAERTKLSNRASVLVVVGALVIIAGLLFWLFGRQAAQEFQALGEQLPAAAASFKEWINESRIGQEIIRFLQQSTQEGSPLSSAGLALGATVGGLANVVLLLAVTLYFAVDPPMYREGALRLLPPARRPQVRAALNDAGSALRKWLIAQLIIMAAVGVMTSIGLALLGVPLWLSLGLIAGILEFVPVVGPLAAAVPGVLLAFSVGPQTAVYVLILYIVVQQIENNVLTPLIQRWAVELPPVIALLSIVAFGLLFGVMGVIFATPLAVVTMAMVQHLYVEDTLEKNRPVARKRARAAGA